MVSRVENQKIDALFALEIDDPHHLPRFHCSAPMFARRNGGVLDHQAPNLRWGWHEFSSSIEPIFRTDHNAAGRPLKTDDVWELGVRAGWRDGVLS